LTALALWNCPFFLFFCPYFCCCKGWGSCTVPEPQCCYCCWSSAASQC
jgi:hypothetical protein